MVPNRDVKAERLQMPSSAQVLVYNSCLQLMIGSMLHCFLCFEQVDYAAQQPAKRVRLSPPHPEPPAGKSNTEHVSVLVYHMHEQLHTCTVAMGATAAQASSRLPAHALNRLCCVLCDFFFINSGSKSSRASLHIVGDLCQQH